MSQAERLLWDKEESETLHGLRTDSETQHFPHRASVSSQTLVIIIVTKHNHFRGLKGKTKRRMRSPQTARCLTSFLLSLVAASGRETRRFTGLYLPKGPAKGQDGGSQKQLASEAAVSQVCGTPHNTQGKLY